MITLNFKSYAQSITDPVRVKCVRYYLFGWLWTPFCVRTCKEPTYKNTDTHDLIRYCTLELDEIDTILRSAGICQTGANGVAELKFRLKKIRQRSTSR